MFTLVCCVCHKARVGRGRLVDVSLLSLSESRVELRLSVMAVRAFTDWVSGPDFTVLYCPQSFRDKFLLNYSIKSK